MNPEVLVPRRESDSELQQENKKDGDYAQQTRLTHPDPYLSWPKLGTMVQ